jgi:hypothetical protein
MNKNVVEQIKLKVLRVNYDIAMHVGATLIK